MLPLFNAARDVIDEDEEKEGEFAEGEEGCNGCVREWVGEKRGGRWRIVDERVTDWFGDGSSTVGWRL